MKCEFKPINCCPICGGTIEVSSLYQYSVNQLVGKRGKLLKKSEKHDSGSLDCQIAYCTNEECGIEWETDDFKLDDEGRFLDYKYSNLEE